MTEHLENISLPNQDFEAAWEIIRRTVYNTGIEHLGPISRKHKDCFGENCIEITELLEEKLSAYKAYKAYIEDTSSNSKKGISWATSHKVQAFLSGTSQKVLRSFLIRLSRIHSGWYSRKLLVPSGW